MTIFQKIEYITLYVGSFFLGYGPEYKHEFIRFIMTVSALVVGGGLTELVKLYIRNRNNRKNGNK